MSFSPKMQVLTLLFPVWVRDAAASCLDSTPAASSPEALRRVATQFRVLLLCAYRFCVAEHAALAATIRSRQMPCAGVQVCLGAGIGIARPQTVAWLSSDLFTYLLGFLMLSMGLTLTFDDFKKVRQGSRAALCMCGLQQPAACLRGCCTAELSRLACG